MTSIRQQMQTIFNNAFFGVLAQDQLAIDKHGTCSYRGPGGTKCSIGHNIPDMYYSKEMEGREAAAITLFTDIPEFVRKLQQTHDILRYQQHMSVSVQMCTYYHDMLDFAERYDLEVP